MDKTTQFLVDYAMAVDYADLPAVVADACKTRLIDTFGCAMGAYDAPLCKQSRAMALRYQGTPAASVLGCERASTAEMAAYANGVMLRFLDLSDSYRVKSGGHPSDMIAGLLAIAEFSRAGGRSLITAIATAYEVYCAFCEAVDINSKGWDQPVYGILGTVLAAGRLAGLTREQLGHAVALALAPNMALHQARRGALSNWKNNAGANASRNAVFAVLLAKDGCTGPTAIFEGRAGVYDVVGRFEWPELGAKPVRITKTHLKSFPVNYHGQSAVWAALDLRDKVKVGDIAKIHVEGYHSAVEEMASDPAHWSPTTHETADHSMPYVLATVLLDGTIDESSFSSEQLSDPRKVRLMNATTVVEDKALTALFPESAPCRMTITRADGTNIQSYVRSPRGHANNPLDKAGVERKFMGLSRNFCDEGQAAKILAALFALENMNDTGEVMRLFVRSGKASA